MKKMRIVFRDGRVEEMESDPAIGVSYAEGDAATWSVVTFYLDDVEVGSICFPEEGEL